MKFSSHFKVQLHFESGLQVGLLIYAYCYSSNEKVICGYCFGSSA